MAYKYKHFIPQNIAPKGATNIGVYNSNGEKIYTIPLVRLTPPTKEKLYSFGALSDIHLIKSGITWNWYPIEKFDRALSHFQEQGCVMCVVSGDLTQCGYRWNDKDDVELTQMANYRTVCEKYSDLPVYEITGNHESYYSIPITNNLDLWEADTGKRDLSYTVEQGNDLFILLGQPTAGTVLESLQWLYETLETNRNKRCFVFIHPWLTDDSGNPRSCVENNVFTMWQNNTGNKNLETVFKNLLAHYKNTVLFHGHSHTKFENQVLDKCANYTDKNGFKSVHIPSSSRPRDVDVETNEAVYSVTESQGYLVDVYDDYIILNGIGLTGVTSADVASKQYQVYPLGTYKIDTPLVTVEANTFTDSTGTITT
jgi:hypothetical protein